MAKSVSIAFVALFVTVSWAFGAYAEWRTYKNTRFGFEIAYPADLFHEGEPPVNDDGRNFDTDDGRAQLKAWASLNSLDQTPRTYLNWIKNEVGVVDEATYERVKNNWMVLSGYTGDNIYYEKTIFSCNGDILNSVSLIYPVAQRKMFDPLVGKITKSLKPARC